MADILLTVGADVAQSYTEFQKDISALVAEVNKTSPKIKVTADVTDANKAVDGLINKISSVSQKKIVINSGGNFDKTIQTCTSKIDTLSNRLADIGKNAHISGVTEAFSQVSAVVENLKAELAALSTSLNSFKGMNLSLNIGGSNSVNRNAAYGQSARQTISDLRSQASELENALMQVQRASDGYSAVLKTIQGTNALQGKDLFSLFNNINNGDLSLSAQMSAWREYIDVIQRAASLKGIDLSGVTSSFSKTANEMIENTNKIRTGEADLESSMNKLRTMFGSSINSEQLDSQLASILTSIDGIKNSINNINGNSLTELTGSINTATDAINKLVSAIGNIKLIFDTDQTEINNLKKQINELYEAIGKTGSGSSGSQLAQGVAKGAKAATVQTRNLQAGVSALVRQTREYGAEAGSVSRVINTYKDAANKTTTVVRKLSEDNGELVVSSTKVTESFKTSAQAAKEYADANKQIEQIISGINKKQASLANVAGGEGSAEYGNLEAYKERFRQLLGTFSQTGDVTTFKTAVADLEAELIKAKTAADGYVNTQRAAAKSSKDNTTKVNAEIQVEKRYHDTLRKVNTAIKNNTAAENSRNATSRASYATIKNQVGILNEAYVSYMKGSITAEEFGQKIAKVNTELSASTGILKENGDATKSLFGRMGGLASKFGAWLSVSQAIMFTIQNIRKMVRASIELDTAMTELKKVTDETDATYNKFLINAESRAKRVGASLTDVVTASADFARLGYNIDDASELADVATIYKNVGDGIQDINEASESIIATMQAFGISASDAMSIVDKFNNVGNNYAISSKGVGDALLRSAAAMKAANNTLDETIALATAANTIVQDPEKVGTTLRTISMFLRAAKTEAEEAGESTEGMASSVSELRDEIMALTGGKVDIQIDDDTFKSTFQILKELSVVWDELTDVSQANILEMVGGKRNSNVVAALLENFSIAEKAVKTSADSAGSALEENAKYLDSVQGKINIMKASFDALSKEFVSGDLLKFFIEGATKAIDLANGTTKVVKSLGGLKTVLTAVAGIVLTMKVDALRDKLINVGDSITKLYGKIRKLPAALRSAKAEGKGLSSALNSVGISTSKLQLAVAAITTVITIATSAYRSWRQAVEQQRQAAIANAQESAQEAESIMDLYSAYRTASDAYKSNAGSKDTLAESTDDLLRALGYEESQIDSLVDKYGDLDKAIGNVTLEALTKAAEEARTAFNAAYDDLQDTSGNGNDPWENFKKFFGLGKNTRIVNWYEDSKDLNRRIGELLVDAGLMDKYGPKGGAMDIDIDSADDIIASYNKLIRARTILQENLDTEEYNESDAVDKIESKIIYFEEILSGYFETKDLLNKSFAKVSLLEALTKNGIPKTSDEVERLKDNLISLAKEDDRFIGSSKDITTAFDYAVNELSNDIPGLKDAMSQSAEEVDAVSEQYALANSKITQSTEQATESVKTLINEISAVQGALSKQQTGKSISIADFSSDELKDYRNALEYVNGAMQLNAERVREIARAKADEQTLTNDKNKYLEQIKYLENAKKIEEYRQEIRKKEEEYNKKARNFRKFPDIDKYGLEVETKAIQKNINALLLENKTIAETCDQYDLLSASLQEAVGDYQHWLNALDSSDYGDMATDAVSAIQKIRDTYDKNSEIFGDYGSKKFSAAIDFIVPDSIDSEDLNAIEKYMASFKKYLIFDDEGAVEDLNVNKFLEDAVKAGLMSYSKDDGFKTLGGKKAEDFVEGLEMSSGMVQAFFDELKLKGAEFDWSDEAVKTIGDLAIEANEAAEALHKIYQDTNLRIKLDVSDISTMEDQCRALEGTIAEMDDIKAKVSIDSSEFDYANTVIQYCLTQKQLLTQPDVMRVDVSKVEEDTRKVISLLQEFQNAQNDFEIKSKVGADTTDAKAKINSLTEEIQKLPINVRTDLSLDTTSEETIKKSIAELDAGTLVVKANIDESAISGYDPETKACTVEYTADISELPDSFPTITRLVKYVKTGFLGDDDVDGDSTRYKVFGFNNPTRNGLLGFNNSTKNGLLEFNDSIRSGTYKFNGLVHAAGTANAGGDWGTAPGGKTLVGELGQEIVVNPRTGRWYTVGDNGAEFRDIPSGSIVFNHLQTKSLLENGYVSGRASALASGTAMVGIGYKPHKANSSSTSRKPPSSKSSSKKDSDKKDDSQIIDWIEIAIDRVERAINRLATVATSPFLKLSERINATNNELSKISSEVSLQQSAYNRYIKQANSVGLSSSLASKVRNGTIDITKYNGDTAKKIKDYQEWYNKALDARDAILELNESIAELYKNKFDDIATDYENKLSLLEHVTNLYNNGIDDLEERGYLASKKYYEALRNVENQNIDVRKQELSDLTKQMSEAIKSGSIKEGSEAWYDFNNQINEIKESIQESETAMIKFANSIREIEWERFDYLQEQIGNIAEEADFLVSLMENSDLYTDNGQLTDTGMASMGLHGQNYNVYMAQADKYAKELLSINKDIAKDPNNTKLLERREELLESQRESILAAEDEKQAIVDMVREGIELELEALQDLIDRYTESLDSAKDLYDYQKKIKDQTSEIASLQRQLSAYSGDTSEESKATIQKLQVDLSDAMESLEETQYDHYISEQKSLLDNLYTEYELVLNERLDNVDALLSDMIDRINANSSSICDTLITEAGKVGYTITENERAIWSNEGAAFSIITKYGESFLTQMTTVNDVISKIAIKIGAMVNESNKKASTTINGTTTASKPKQPAKQPSKQQAQTNNKKPASATKGNISDDVKRGIATAIWIYGSKSGWGNNPNRKKKLTAKLGSANASAIESYLKAHANNGDLYKYWVSTGKSKLSQYYYSAFKKGGLADYTGVAWLDGTPSEPEMVLNPEDTSNFIALKDAMRSIADGKGSLADLFSGNEGSANILKQLAKIESPMSARGFNIGDITYQITIPIDHVQDYNDFVNQLRKDGKFEKMIQSMTVDRLVGGSKLAKNKYQW